MSDPDISYTLQINGEARAVSTDVRSSLLDVLREELGLTGTKKGCDHGQCGACTVISDDRRVLSCLTLAIAAQGRQITTIEGLAGALPAEVPPQHSGAAPETAALHPMQRAFIDRDALQCGFCTPGQICSAVAMLAEVAQGWPSAVTADVATETITLTEDEVRERMSGNLCRCGAYANIVPAIMDAAAQGGAVR